MGGLLNLETTLSLESSDSVDFQRGLLENANGKVGLLNQGYRYIPVDFDHTTVELRGFLLPSMFIETKSGRNAVDNDIYRIHDQFRLPGTFSSYERTALLLSQNYYSAIQGISEIANEACVSLSVNGRNVDEPFMLNNSVYPQEYQIGCFIWGDIVRRLEESVGIEQDDLVRLANDHYGPIKRTGAYISQGLDSKLINAFPEIFHKYRNVWDDLQSKVSFLEVVVYEYSLGITRSMVTTDYAKEILEQGGSIDDTVDYISQFYNDDPAFVKMLLQNIRFEPNQVGYVMQILSDREMYFDDLEFQFTDFEKPEPNSQIGLLGELDYGYTKFAFQTRFDDGEISGPFKISTYLSGVQNLITGILTLGVMSDFVDGHISWRDAIFYPFSILAIRKIDQARKFMKNNKYHELSHRLSMDFSSDSRIFPKLVPQPNKGQRRLMQKIGFMRYFTDRVPDYDCSYSLWSEI